MNPKKIKLLLISHCAYRTGAPVLLFNVGKLLKETGKYEIRILLRAGGEMEADFSSLGETFVWSNYFPHHYKKNILYRIKYKFFLRKAEEEKRSMLLDYLRTADFIINNTITNGELLALLTKGYSGKVISYIHELQMSTLKFATVKGVDFTMKLSQAFITPCLAVKKYLEETYALHPSKITLINSYIPQIEFPSDVFQHQSNNEMLTIGCSGTADLRKGFDIFILLAKYIYSQDLQHKFKMIWKGVNPGSELYLQGLIDIEKAGLNDLISLLPADDKMGGFYNYIDIFLLLSREDPYPLVVLEAASFAKPTVCFESAGGAPEFVQDDAGTVVEYLDIIGLANALDTYQKNPDLVKQQGNIAKERVQQKHQDKNLVLAQLNQILND